MLLQIVFTVLLCTIAKSELSESEESLCGTVTITSENQQSNSSTVIPNGKIAPEGQFPWVAAVYEKGQNGDLDFLGSGVLISKFYILSAGSVVTSLPEGNVNKPQNILIFFGKHDLRRFAGPNVQLRKVSNIIRHPDYDLQKNRNDLALIKSSQRIDYTDYVRPICLWQDTEDVTDKKGTVIGWMNNANSAVAEEITKLSLPVVTRETCIKSDPDFFSKYTSDRNFCAGGESETWKCFGILGLHMAFPQKSESHRWQLRGLISIGLPWVTAQCTVNDYVVFTDVAKHLDWIKESISA